MKIVPNPEYVTAPFEENLLNEFGRVITDPAVLTAFYGSPLNPRFKRLPDGKFVRVPSHIEVEDDWRNA